MTIAGVLTPIIFFNVRRYTLSSKFQQRFESLLIAEKEKNPRVRARLPNALEKCDMES